MKIWIFRRSGNISRSNSSVPEYRNIPAWNWAYFPNTPHVNRKAADNSWNHTSEHTSLLKPATSTYIVLPWNVIRIGFIYQFTALFLITWRTSTGIHPRWKEPISFLLQVFSISLMILSSQTYSLLIVRIVLSYFFRIFKICIQRILQYADKRDTGQSFADNVRIYCRYESVT